MGRLSFSRRNLHLSHQFLLHSPSIPRSQTLFEWRGRGLNGIVDLPEKTQSERFMRNFHETQEGRKAEENFRCRSFHHRERTLGGRHDTKPTSRWKKKLADLISSNEVSEGCDMAARVGFDLIVGWLQKDLSVILQLVYFLCVLSTLNKYRRI